MGRHLTARRERMAWLCEQAAPMSGEIEVDESHFGAHGDSYASALANVMQSTELLIATAEEFGDPVSQPKSARLMYA